MPRPLVAAATMLLASLTGWPLHGRAQAPADVDADAPPIHACPEGGTLATGTADASIFAREASRGVAAFWCESYDQDGHAHRAGPYWDHHPDGSLRTRTRYVGERIEGPVEVFDEDGTLWLRGELVGGEWSGAFELFHANGHRWLSAHFREGRLEGPVETWFSDGRLQSTTEPNAPGSQSLPMARLERRDRDRADGAAATADPIVH